MTTLKHPHLLLLPGLLNDGRLWQHQINALSDTAYASVADLTAADTIAELATAALSQMRADRFALAGLSMGGYVALEIMRQAPERVSALALLDTSARADTQEATQNRKKLMQQAETNFPSVIDALLPKLVHTSQMHNTALLEQITAMALSVGKDAFLRQQRAIMGRIDSLPSLSKITCPTLVLCGREDVITPVEVHRELVGGIPDSKLVVVEKCGHLSTLGQPQDVTNALKQWLQDAHQ